MKYYFYAAIMFLASAAAALGATDCSPTAEEVDALCYPGNIQAAVNAALASDRPLLMPRGTYRISQPLVIDYARSAGTGFELISRGAIIDGTGSPTAQLVITCSGGTAASPKGCFYFHQEGTLFVNANTPWYAVRVGNNDFSDAHNSIKVDHLVVSNAGDGGACRFNYILNADLFAVCDTAGSGAGIDLRQLQFSTLKGAGSAAQGPAMAIETGYVISNTFQSLDLEASPTCLLNTSPNAAGNAFAAVYKDCPIGEAVAPGSTNGNAALAGVTGGATVLPTVPAQ